MKQIAAFLSAISFLCLSFIPHIASGNYVEISNVRLSSVQKEQRTAYINFNVKWENSWRTDKQGKGCEAPYNHDAVWIFIKYKTNNSWHHVYLPDMPSICKIGINNGVEPQIRVGKCWNLKQKITGGLFLFRKNNGKGNIDWQNVEIQWHYPEHLNIDMKTTEIQVFGIEMVYVPEGEFYVGDGANPPQIGSFFEAKTKCNPYFITSEKAFTLGDVKNSLMSNKIEDMYTEDDFDDNTTRILPQKFPKGYNGYFCMKYEVSQREFVGFLNTLTARQQKKHIEAQHFGEYMHLKAGIKEPQGRNGIKCIKGIIDNNPALYACDLDNDNRYNEPEDGLYIACNWISWLNAAAFADWAGLRPMTELEYEKACRGNKKPVPFEYAWGTTEIVPCGKLKYAGEKREMPVNPLANCNVDGYKTTNGAVRTGCFASTEQKRQYTGKSYYQICELSGNVLERCITLGNSKGRQFTGLHGDGEISTSGKANVAYWPDSDALGVGFRGGSWHNETDGITVSLRQFACYTSTKKFDSYGFRAVRSAE